MYEVMILHKIHIYVFVLVLATIVGTAYATTDDIHVIKYKVGINSYAIIEEDGKRIILRGHRAEALLQKLGLMSVVTPHSRNGNGHHISEGAAKTYIEENTNIIGDINKTIKPPASVTPILTHKITDIAPPKTKKSIGDMLQNPKHDTVCDGDILSRIEQKLDTIISLLERILKAISIW